MTSADWIEPDFASPLDVDAAILRTPAFVKTKGMFIRAVADLGKRAAPSREAELYVGLERRQWMPFLDYPLRDLMRLLVNVVPLRFPGVPMREGLRRLGWTAYPTFAESMAGKVVFGAVGSEVESILGVADRGLSLSISHGKVVSRRLEPGYWELFYSDIWCFFGCYHVGVIEGLFRSKQMRSEIRLKLRDEQNGVMHLRF